MVGVLMPLSPEMRGIGLRMPLVLTYRVRHVVVRDCLPNSQWLMVRRASWTEAKSQRFSQLSRKTLVMSVLPGAARRNKVGLDLLRTQPSSDLLCNELGAIVTLHIPRSATL
jgi:hypothetical protein